MTIKRFPIPQFQYLLVGALIFMITGGGSLSAQESTLPPGHAQVIAQGIDFIPGEDLHWRADVIAVEPIAAEKPVELTGGFIFSPDGTLVASRTQGDAELISPNQATFAPSSITKSIHSADDQAVDALKVELATGEVLDTGAFTAQFQVPEGDYNLQLTRGLLDSGDVDVFTPVNEAIYFLWVPNGTIEVNTLGQQDQIELVTGDTLEASGEIEVRAVGDDPAAYVIVSIGALVPNLSQPVAPLVQEADTGEILVLFYNCGPTAYAEADADQCELNWEPIPVTLSSFIDGPPKTITSAVDAEQLPDGTWLFADTPAGDWSFDLMDVFPDPVIYALTGDAYQTNAGWAVEVEPGLRSVVRVLLSVDEPGEVNAVSILYVNCPSGDTEYNVSMDCDLATDHPVGYLQGPDSDPSVQTTSQHATYLDVGTYRFEGLALGTYNLSIEYNDVWTPDNTYFVGDGYVEGATWYIDLEVGPYPVVYIAREGGMYIPPAPGGTDAPTDVSYGYVLIMQNECAPTQDASNCVLAVDPWEVVLMNTATGEVYTLTQNSTPTTPGTWQLLLPAGIYQVEVYDAGWIVDYPTQLEVFPDTEVWLFIDGYAP